MVELEWWSTPKTFEIFISFTFAQEQDVHGKVRGVFTFESPFPSLFPAVRVEGGSSTMCGAARRVGTTAVMENNDPGV